jgi:hypothetical protein
MKMQVVWIYCPVLPPFEYNDLGCMDLLSCVLEEYRNIPDKMNSQDRDGSTALHILVRSGIGSPDKKLRVLDLLLEYKCSASIVDRFNKKPIDYAHQHDILYEKLQTASKSGRLILQ